MNDIVVKYGSFDLKDYSEFISTVPCDNGNFNHLDPDYAKRLSGTKHIISEARINGEIVGFLMLIPIDYIKRVGTTIENHSIGYTTLFTVSKDYRKKGVAKELIKGLIKGSWIKFNALDSAYAMTEVPRLEYYEKTSLFIRPIRFDSLQKSGFQIPPIEASYRDKNLKSELYFSIPSKPAAISRYELTRITSKNSSDFFMMYSSIEKTIMVSFSSFSELSNHFDTWCIKDPKTEDFGIFMINPYIVKTSKTSKTNVAMISMFMSNNPKEMLDIALKAIRINYPTLQALYSYEIGFLTAELLKSFKFLHCVDWTMSMRKGNPIRDVPMNENLLPVF